MIVEDVAASHLVVDAEALAAIAVAVEVQEEEVVAVSATVVAVAVAVVLPGKCASSEGLHRRSIAT